MNDPSPKGRRMLMAAGVLYIILSVPGGDGAALGLTVAISALGLAAGILGVRWCARPDKAGALLALGVVLAVLVAMNLLLNLGGGSISAMAGALVRLVLSALYAAGAWQNRQSLG